MVQTRRRDEGGTGAILVILVVLLLVAQLPRVLGQPGYLGCYEDSKDDRALGGPSWKDVIEQSWEWCIHSCVSYQYMGLEFGNECFCGRNVDYGRHGSRSGCTMACEGNSSETCGGRNRIEVYRGET
ncbi:WSC domain-containing protein 2-like [Patiria miniata]|uniref:WSC domain-containing protein n=1 Tax=Patiria miniata TaxID=46514 RepID=A0A913ZIM1_PATMI|nr:WSC domain-containing protein 2-like [Patiria miniata]